MKGKKEWEENIHRKIHIDDIYIKKNNYAYEQLCNVYAIDLMNDRHDNDWNKLVFLLLREKHYVWEKLEGRKIHLKKVANIISFLWFSCCIKLDTQSKEL